MKSEKVDLLAMALVMAQSEMPAVGMNATNKFLGNRYADLAEMIRVATPVLAKNGLSISQQPVSVDGQVGVTTTLLHASGQWIEDTISLPLGDEKGKSLAQVAGSIITYLRRYSYGAIVGLATDEDTDGNAPSKNHEQPKVAYEAKAEPQKSNSKMTLEFALNETNSKGEKYGDLDTETLSHMANALQRVVKRTDDQQRKLDAAQTILANRAASSGA
jgi:hypothetical protein